MRPQPQLSFTAREGFQHIQCSLSLLFRLQCYMPHPCRRSNFFRGPTISPKQAPSLSPFCPEAARKLPSSSRLNCLPNSLSLSIYLSIYFIYLLFLEEPRLPLRDRRRSTAAHGLHVHHVTEGLFGTFLFMQCRIPAEILYTCAYHPLRKSTSVKMRARVQKAFIHYLPYAPQVVSNPYTVLRIHASIHASPRGKVVQ